MTRTFLTLLAIAAMLGGEAYAQSAAAIAPTSRTVVESEQFVQLRNGETIVGVVSLDRAPESARSVEANGTTYQLADVSEFASADGEFAVYQMTASRFELLERTTHGRMQIYRPARTGGIEYYQMGDGPIRPLTTADLRQHFAGHDAAMQHMNRERFYGNVGVGAMAVGGALVATGAVIEFGNIEGPSGIAIAGSGVLFAVAVNGIVPLLQRGARNNAIAAYNR